MKKTLAFLCIVVIVATTLLPLIALADTRYVYTKDGKSLNLRSTPKSNTGNKIGNIPYGTKIIVREYLDDGWAYVKYGTVSYTHLDVYKRQSRRCCFWTSRWARWT